MASRLPFFRPHAVMLSEKKRSKIDFWQINLGFDKLRELNSIWRGEGRSEKESQSLQLKIYDENCA